MASESARQGGGVVALAFLMLLVAWFGGLHLLRGGDDATAEYTPTCTTTNVKAGDDLPSSLVLVDVYNGSGRSGLAGTVSSALKDRGFRQGVVANSPSQLKPYDVTIMAMNPDDPRVQLVAQQFDHADIRTPDFATGSGVAVIIGDDFTALKADAPQSIKASSDVSVCY